jgi:hypothetical protein
LIRKARLALLISPMVYSTWIRAMLPLPISQRLTARKMR